MDYGTEALNKLLAEVQTMSVEEYNRLFNLAQEEYKGFFERIQEVEELGSSYLQPELTLSVKEPNIKRLASIDTYIDTYYCKLPEEPIIGKSPIYVYSLQIDEQCTSNSELLLAA